MCGRYALDVTGEEIAAAFGAALGSAVTWTPSWNVAPTREVPIVRRGGDGPRVDLLRWGLVPAWADDVTVGSRMINARAETVSVKPAYRDSFRGRRCIVPIRAFYEWRREGRGPARPFAIRAGDRGLVGLAGLWTAWHASGAAAVETFAIITTAAGDRLRSVHDRMPVVLGPEVAEVWLDHRSPEVGGPDDGRLQAILAAATDADLVMERVSARVNRVGDDGPDLLEVLGDDEEAPSQGGLFGEDFHD